MHSAGSSLRAPIEGYRKTDTPEFVAARFAALVGEAGDRVWEPHEPRTPAFVGSPEAVSFPIGGGTLWIDRSAWGEHSLAIVAQSSGLLRDDGREPALAVSLDEIAKKDSELIACEVECRGMGIEGVFVELEIPGLCGAGKRVL